MGDLGWGRTLLFAVLVLALPPVVTWLVSKALGSGEVGRVLTSAAAMLSVLGVWLRSASGAAATVDKAIAEVTRAYEDRIRNDPAVKAARQEMKSASSAAATAAEALAAAERELRKAEAAAAAV